MKVAKHHGLIMPFALVVLIGAVAVIAQIPSAVAAPQITIRPNTRIQQMSDLKGALMYTQGGAIQIDEVVWQIHSDGRLDISDFRGYDQSGQWVEVSRPVEDARIVSAVEDLYGFYLGESGNPNRTWVENIVFSTDEHGFLQIIELYGFEDLTSREISYSSAVSETCGLYVTTGCNANACNGTAAHCGAYPGCPCLEGSGSCSGFSSSICTGTCPANERCNGSVNDCKCVVKGPVLTSWGQLVLVALLILGGVFVIYQRRRGLVTR